MSKDKIGNKIVLSTDQMDHLDNNEADRLAEETTLKIALQRHANRTSELRKDIQKWWSDIATNLGVSVETHVMKWHTVNGVVVVEVMSLLKDEQEE